MATYQPFTKKIIDKDGNEFVVCQFNGTEQCRSIHKTSEGCIGCPVLGAMIIQLNAFEEKHIKEEEESERNKLRNT